MRALWRAWLPGREDRAWGPPGEPAPARERAPGEGPRGAGPGGRHGGGGAPEGPGPEGEGVVVGVPLEGAGPDVWRQLRAADRGQLREAEAKRRSEAELRHLVNTKAMLRERVERLQKEMQEMKQNYECQLTSESNAVRRLQCEVEVLKAKEEAVASLAPDGGELAYLRSRLTDFALERPCARCKTPFSPLDNPRPEDGDPGEDLCHFHPLPRPRFGRCHDCRLEKTLNACCARCDSCSKGCRSAKTHVS